MPIIGYVTPDRPETFSTDAKPDMLDVLVGETVTLRSDGHPITDVVPVAVPEGEHIYTDESLTPATPGRYHYRAKTLEGVDTDVSLIVCEPECLARIPDESQATHQGRVDKRRVLRELGRFAPDFTGLADQIPNRNLTQFGA